MTTKTKTVAKSKKTETTTPAVNATALIAAANGKPLKTEAPVAKTAAEKKAERDAERAKRYPTAAKQEAEAKAAKEAGAKEGKAEKVKNSPPPPKEVVKFIAQVMKPGTPVFVLRMGKRPSNGARMFAHTHAALAFLGMLGESRPAVPESQLVTFLGQTAVTYHKAQHNLESGPNQTIRLAQGSKLLGRTIDGKIANAFLEVFRTGKPSAEAGVGDGDAYSTAF